MQSIPALNAGTITISQITTCKFKRTHIMAANAMFSVNLRNPSCAFINNNGSRSRALIRPTFVQRRRIAIVRAAASAESGGVGVKKMKKQHPHNPFLQLHQIHLQPRPQIVSTETENENGRQLAMEKLRVVAEAAADRADVRAALAEQRDGWNKLLLSSFHSFSASSLALSAASLLAFGQLPESSASAAFLVTSAAAMSVAAAATAALLHFLQPSQLAEEQRIAARLMRNLNRQITGTLTADGEEEEDEEAAAEAAYRELLSIDRAYPMPLFPGMLPRFPETVEAPKWWDQPAETAEGADVEADANGWSADVDSEMDEVARLLRERDIPEYERLAGMVVRANKAVSTAAVAFTAAAGVAGMIAATAVGFGNVSLSATAVGLGMVMSCMGKVAGSMSHAGQMGMVFEMYRGALGFYTRLHSTVAADSSARRRRRRVPAEVMRWQIGLQLGREHEFPMVPLPSSSSAQKSASSSSSSEGFASKLF